MPHELGTSFGPVRKTERLHLGRISISSAQYFVTLVTEQRKPWLSSPRAVEFLFQTWRRAHSDGAVRILAATVMPDHAHVLFELGGKVSVGQIVARWKADVRRGLDHADAFQRDFWEHRVRSIEDPEDYALYIFLNPYRAGLIPAERLWPGWWVPEPRLFRFSASLDEKGCPPGEWVAWPDEKFEKLRVGE